MKMVIAYVQTFMADKVLGALQAIPEVPGASLIEVQGFGRGRGKGELSHVTAEESPFGTLAKRRIETVIPDELEDKVVETIKENARTGEVGAGKIYVISIDRAVRIRTGEEGKTAL